jgi:hypothetical protein
VHAAAFAAVAPPPSSTWSPHEGVLGPSNAPQDAASAVLVSALRHIVRKCSASTDPRLSCLHNVKQLDRIPPGSRAEARAGGGLVPRFRGDVHADLTALTATFLLSGPVNSTVRPFALCRGAGKLSRVCSEGTLLDKVVGRGSLRHMTAHASSPRLVVLGGATSLVSKASDSPTAPGLRQSFFGGIRTALRCRQFCSHHSLTVHSTSALPTVPSDTRQDTLPHSPGADRESPASAGSCAVTHSEWHWQVLASHARAIAGEVRLRQGMWLAAIDLAQQQQPVAGGPDSDRQVAEGQMQQQRDQVV